MPDNVSMHRYSFLNTHFTWIQTNNLQILFANKGSIEPEALQFLHHDWSHNIREGQGYPSTQHFQTAKMSSQALPRIHTHIDEAENFSKPKNLSPPPPPKKKIKQPLPICNGVRCFFRANLGTEQPHTFLYPEQPHRCMDGNQCTHLFAWTVAATTSTSECANQNRRNPKPLVLKANC